MSTRTPWTRPNRNRRIRDMPDDPEEAKHYRPGEEDE